MRTAMKATMISALSALIFAGLALTVETASATCGYCTPSCTRGNYSECHNYCMVRPAGLVTPQAQQCWCEEQWAECAWTFKQVGADGAVYAYEGLTGREVSQNGNRLLLACDGTILARFYNGETVAAVRDHAREIAI